MDMEVPLIVIADFPYTCRLCLSNEPELTLHSLIDDTVAAVYRKCLRETADDDSLPQNICSYCLEKCETWTSFQESCLQNENLLRMIILQCEDSVEDCGSATDDVCRSPIVLSDIEIDGDSQAAVPNDESMDSTSNPSPVKVYQCACCDLEFTKLGLYRKQTRKHNSRKGFECQHCGECQRCFRKKDTLNVHMKVHRSS